MTDDRERGSVALELTLIAPALLAVVALVLAYGRYSQVTGIVETAARDAARAATQSRSSAEAEERVERIVRQTLANAAESCASTAAYDIEDDGFLPGGNVTVTVRCEVGYGDLGAPFGGGTKTITRSFTSPLDPYRGVRR